jgi:nucleotide-binding universal stress UspA family protein
MRCVGQPLLRAGFLWQCHAWHVVAGNVHLDGSGHFAGFGSRRDRTLASSWFVPTLRKEVHMSHRTPARQVVVAYDFSPTADMALELALELACRSPQHVLHFVAAIDARSGLGLPVEDKVDYEYAERVQKALYDQLAGLFEGRTAAGVITYFVHARIGNPSEEILDLAREVGADLIVIGSHGRTGLERVVLGSVSEKVMREARCPVMVARAKGYPEVELETIVDAPGERRRYVQPHRYSYSSDIAQTRPDAWPVS